MTIPSREECQAILRMVGMERNVVGHVELVESIASAIAEAIDRRHPGAVDPALVTAGALLHDLGRARTHDVTHARVGVEMAQELGLDPRIVEIIRRHVGAGLEPDEAEALGLPRWDGMPRTLEEKIVCHADTLTSSRGRLTLAEVVEDIRRQGVPAWERKAVALHRELSALAGEDLDRIGPPLGRATR
jgi:uncharacterized protein (TIGR00295 family)